MVFRPAVFVSYTRGELEPFRDVVFAALREMGAEPIEYKDLSVSYGPLDGLLKLEIGRCDVVIHLTGYDFGLEPGERTHGAPRRSFSHYEMDVATALRKTTLCFVADRSIVAGRRLTDEDDEARTLQAVHRREVEKLSEHWAFDSTESLAKIIRGLRSRIMMRRRFVRLPFPARGAELFGRERQLAELCEALQNSSFVVVHPPEKSSVGSTSAGKTALAIEAGWKLYETQRFDFVFWIAGDNQTAIESSIASLARSDSLALLQDEIAEHRVRLDAVRQWLRQEQYAGKYLVIFDGVDNQATSWAVRSMMPWFASGTVLVTSRLPLCWEDAKEVSIGAISMDAAVAMLARLSRPGQQPLPSERGHFERLAAALGRQPLALRLAGLSMADARSNAEQFLAKLAESAGSTAGAQWTQVANWLALTSKVIRQSVGRLDATGRLYLQMFASLAPEPAAIPTAIFSGRSDDEQIHATLQRLEKLGLIESIDEGKSVMMHRSVREMIRDRMSPEEQATALDAARALIEAALPRSERSSSGASVREKLVPHCRVLLGQLNGHPLEIHATRLAHGLAAWLRDCRRSSEAEHFQRRALAIAEKSCEKGHPDLIPELRHLAVILRENRSYDQAEALHRRAIAILEEQPASETKDLISELYGLGSCLRAAARYDEAEEVLLRILHLEEKHYGPAHPRTSIAAHALGAVYELAGRPQDAIPLYRRALQIDEKTRAIGAQRLAVRYHHLAGAVLAIGRLSEAVTLHEKGIELDEQSIGSDAPEIAPPLKQLADIYLRQNRLDMAENALRRILKLESTGIGEEHIEYALTLIALADLLQKSSRGDEALTLAEKAKAIVDRWATSRRNCHPLVRIVCGEADRILGAGESTR